MRIIVLARRFEKGSWKPWKHICDEEEVAAVQDSAKAKAFSRSFSTVLDDADYLQAAGYVFNRAYGSPEKPVEGDLRVTMVEASIVAHAKEDNLIDHLTHKRTA